MALYIAITLPGATTLEEGRELVAGLSLPAGSSIQLSATDSEAYTIEDDMAPPVAVAIPGVPIDGGEIEAIPEEPIGEPVGEGEIEAIPEGG